MSVPDDGMSKNSLQGHHDFSRSIIIIDDDDSEDDVDTIILRGSYFEKPDDEKQSSVKQRVSRKTQSKKTQGLSKKQQSTYEIASQSLLEKVAKPIHDGWKFARVSAMQEPLPKVAKCFVSNHDSIPTWSNVDEQLVNTISESIHDKDTPTTEIIKRMFKGQIGLFIDVGVTCTGVTILWQRNAVETCPSCIVFHDNIDMKEDFTDEQLCLRYNLNFLPDENSRWDETHGEEDVWNEDVRLYENMEHNIHVVAKSLLASRVNRKHQTDDDPTFDDIDGELSNVLCRMGGVLPIQTQHLIQKCALASSMDLSTFSPKKYIELPSQMVSRGAMLFSQITRFATFIRRCFGEMDIIAIEAQPITYGFGGVADQMQFVNALSAVNPNAKFLPSVSASRKLRVNQLELETLGHLKNDRSLCPSVRRHSLIGPSGTLVSMSSSKRASDEIEAKKAIVAKTSSMEKENHLVDNSKPTSAKKTKSTGDKQSKRKTERKHKNIDVDTNVGAEENVPPYLEDIGKSQIVQDEHTSSSHIDDDLVCIAIPPDINTSSDQSKQQNVVLDDEFEICKKSEDDLDFCAEIVEKHDFDTICRFGEDVEDVRVECDKSFYEDEGDIYPPTKERKRQRSFDNQDDLEDICIPKRNISFEDQCSQNDDLQQCQDTHDLITKASNNEGSVGIQPPVIEPQREILVSKQPPKATMGLFQMAKSLMFRPKLSSSNFPRRQPVDGLKMGDTNTPNKSSSSLNGTR